MTTQNIKIITPYSDIVNSMSHDDIINGINGSSNLLANYLNDYSSSSINCFTAEFLQSNAQYIDSDEIELILENYDFIIAQSASEFFNGISLLYPDFSNSNYIFNNAKYYFDGIGDYFLFAEPISNAISRYYIIRAENENEALNWLLCEFEKDFIIADEDRANDDSLYNDNGTPCNIDNLQLLAKIEFKNIGE